MRGSVAAAAVAIVLGTPAAQAATAAMSAPESLSSEPPSQAQHRSSAAGREIETLMDQWRFLDADKALLAMSRARPGDAEVLYLEGYARFLAGDYPGALAKLKSAGRQVPGDREVGALLILVEGADKATTGHNEARSAHFIMRYPPEDAVLSEFALESLEAMLTALHEDLGFTPTRPIIVDIYRSPTDLAAVSTLSEAEVLRTGTIALCKWARLMATTPRALRFGYPWQDSLSHELVHYVVSSLSADHAPVWLQEGLAKFLERRWRQPPGGELPPSMQHLLARALATNKLISFEAMHPSMAKLPKAEDASLAFAEVATAMAALHAKGGVTALRTAVGYVRDGMDARQAVALSAAGTWSDFEKSWRVFMAAKKYRIIPGMDPVTRKFRKPGAISSKRGPSEDEEILESEPSQRFLRLGNMLLLRRRLKAATIEYEKGAKANGAGHWMFPVKLGRAYLALGEPDRALQAVSETLTLYPELPWPNLIAGQALLAKGQPDKAILALQASLATNPFDPAVHCAMADAYQKLPVDANNPARLHDRAVRLCNQLAAP